MAGIFERFYNNLLAELDVYHVIRLVVIVGGYLIIRARAQDWLKTRQLKTQLEHDKARKAEGLIDRTEDQHAELEELTGGEASGSDATWGWGKKTRKRNAAMQRRFEEAVEAAAVNAQLEKENNDSDEDIAEFLED